MANNEFYRDEFKEAYSHYRHLEQERSRHITFFFTIVAGLLGVFGVLAKGGAPNDLFRAFWGLWFISIIFLQILALLTFASVRRTGCAREIHGEVIRLLRKKLDDNNVVSSIWESFHKPSHLSVQRSAELCLHVVSAFLSTGALGLSYFAFISGVVAPVVSLMAIVVAALALLAYVIVCFQMRVPSKMAT